MRIQSVSIKNFRSFRDCKIIFDEYTTLVGANGSGKSTVLCALNIFFREREASPTNLIDLDEEDFHNRDTDNPIEITVTFSDLTQSAKDDFSDYVRQNLLIITARAEFDKVHRIATVRQFGQRSAMSLFAPFFKAFNDGASAADCKKLYEQVTIDVGQGLPKAGPKDAMKGALRAYEDAHPELCILIPSEDQFYGFSKGANRLARHIQWVYLPAVKNATQENIEAKNTALGQILARTVRATVDFGETIKKLKEDTRERYREILAQQQDALSAVSKSLTERLAYFAHPEATARLTWMEDLKKSVQIDEPMARLFAGEGNFEGELARFGHGLQRSYLLALLQELSMLDDDQSPTLILAIEEPELYQHPLQSRYLSDVLQKLSSKNSQIMISTHSPYFISSHSFESVRMVRRNVSERRADITSVSYETLSGRLSNLYGKKIERPNATMARMTQALQPNLTEMFFAPRIIFVEGIEDIAYLTTWLMLNDKWQEFRRYGAHLISVNGKSLLLEPLVIAEQLAIPHFCLFDSDGDEQKPSNREKHERDNTNLLKLLSDDECLPFPTETVWNPKFVQWPTNLGATVKAEVDAKIWQDSYAKVQAALGHPKGSLAKNPQHISMHLSQMHSQGVFPPSLEKLQDRCLAFAQGSALNKS